MPTSGHALFDRRCRLTIANPVAAPNDFKNVTTDVVEIDGGVSDKAASGLRVKFKIVKTLKKEPNTSEIQVYNLSPSRRSSLQQKGVKVLLEAGYAGTDGISRYSSGDVRTIDHIREGADWNTTMHLGDGERAWNYARVNESFAPGTQGSDIFKVLAKAAGLDLGNVDKASSIITKVFDQGYAACGSAMRAFDQFVDSVGEISWSVQDGQIQVLKLDAVLDLPIPEITPQNGLIGSPEMGTPRKKGAPALVKFKSLLIPTKPGAKVRLKSSRYNGFLKVVSCVFTGDTHGGEWYSEIEGEILK